MTGYREPYSAHEFAPERVARNEVASREFNDRSKRPTRGSRPPIGSTSFAGALKMWDRSIDITMAEYRMVRSDARQFAIVPEHLIGDIERIISENDRFAAVIKREGTPAEVAMEETPEASVPGLPRGRSPRRRGIGTPESYSVTA